MYKYFHPPNMTIHPAPPRKCRWLGHRWIPVYMRLCGRRFIATYCERCLFGKEELMQLKCENGTWDEKYFHEWGEANNDS